MSGSGRYGECFKCGADIRRHLSAYQPWDEMFTLRWRPASGDDDHVAESDDAKHPNSTSRIFCSRDCLESFIQMDYSLKPRTQDADK